MRHCLERAPQPSRDPRACRARGAADIRLAQSTSVCAARGVTIEGRIAPATSQVRRAGAGHPRREYRLAGVPGGNLSEACASDAHPAACPGSPGASRFTRIPCCTSGRGQQYVRERVLLPVCRGGQPAGVGAWHPQTRTSGEEYFAVGPTSSRGAPANRKATVAYLDLMGAPARYAPLMLTTSSSTMAWLSPDDIARDFTGIAPGTDEQAQGRLPDDPALPVAKTAVQRDRPAQRTRAPVGHRWGAGTNKPRVALHQPC